MKLREAQTKILRRGALLVYPLQNRTEPASLWSEFFPRTKMRWEWDSGGDDRVAKMWRLREELSRSDKVVYAKWYQNRATFFSPQVFVALQAFLRPLSWGLSPTARQVLTVLEEDSPLSTKELKRRTGLTGRGGESTYEKTLRELWRCLLIVGYGEVDDGAFPSLAVGATSALFDTLKTQADQMDETGAEKALVDKLGEKNVFLLFARKLKGSVRTARPAKDKLGTVRYEDLIRK